MEKVFFTYSPLIPNDILPNDVWLVSFPRSGNTWMRFLLGNIMTQYCRQNIKMDFNIMEKIIPDIHISRDIPLNLGFAPFPRIIKSHEWCNKKYERVVYIVRNPKDVLISYYYFLKNGRKENVGDFSSFIRNKYYGVPAWCWHVSEWSKRWNVVVVYEDLLVDVKRNLKKILSYLKVDVDDCIIDSAIKQSSLDRMQQLERSDSGWKSKHRLDQNFLFVDGQKNELNLFDKKDKKYLLDQIKKYELDLLLEKFNYVDELQATKI